MKFLAVNMNIIIITFNRRCITNAIVTIQFFGTDTAGRSSEVENHVGLPNRAKYNYFQYVYQMLESSMHSGIHFMVVVLKLVSSLFFPMYRAK